MLKPLRAEVLLRPRVGAEEQDRRADEQADVADAHGEERLERGPGVGLLLPPVPDQHERAEAHDLPAEDELDHVLGEDHHEHAGGEQRDGGEEVGVAAVAAHVLERVDLHEQRDEGDEQRAPSRRARRCAGRCRSSTPPFCHHVHDLMTGATNGSPCRPRWRRCCGRSRDHAERPGLVARRRRRRCAGSTGTRRRWRARATAAIEAMPTSEPFIGRRLPNRMMTEKAIARDDRDQPGVLEEPARGDRAITSALHLARARRARSSGGCGTRAAPWPGRRRPRRRRRR